MGYGRGGGCRGIREREQPMRARFWVINQSIRIACLLQEKELCAFEHFLLHLVSEFLLVLRFVPGKSINVC